MDNFILICYTNLKLIYFHIHFELATASIPIEIFLLLLQKDHIDIATCNSNSYLGCMRYGACK